MNGMEIVLAIEKGKVDGDLHAIRKATRARERTTHWRRMH